MTLLAQAKEVLDAGTKVLDQASVWGPASFYLAVFFLFFCLMTAWLCQKVILPVATATSESLKMNSETLAAMGQEHAVLKSHLSDIRNVVLKRDTWPSDDESPPSGNISQKRPQPHGA